MARSAPAAAPLPVDEWNAEQEGDALLTELLADDANETDALLAELLGEQPPWNPHTQPPTQHCQPPPQPSTDEVTPETKARPTKRRASVRKDGSVPAMRVDKRTLTLTVLRDEVNQLTNELKRLRSETSTAIEPYARTAKEIAIDERLKRRRVEDECRQLREAVYAQTQFLRGLRSVFAMPMPLSPVDLTHYLHNYTRLPRDRSTRWSEYAALAQGARFQAAMDMLCRETQRMNTADEQTEVVPSLSSPFIRTEVLPHSDGFSVMSTNVYALATDDLSAALRGVCMAVHEIPARDPVYICTSRKKQLVDPDASLPSATASNIVYRVMGVDHKIDQDQLAVESHNVALYKQTQNYALLLEDFVDHDDLHPQDETTDITRQVVGACMIRRERCSDGLEHTVFRSLRTRRYRFHEHTPPAVLKRFQQLIAEAMNANDLIFRQLILDSIAQEEQALMQAMDRFTVPV